MCSGVKFETPIELARPSSRKLRSSAFQVSTNRPRAGHGQWIR